MKVDSYFERLRMNEDWKIGYEDKNHYKNGLAIIQECGHANTGGSQQPLQLHNF
jgi:hypothetical protein